MAGLEERVASLEATHDRLAAMLVSIQRGIALATSSAATAETLALEARDRTTQLSRAVAAFTNELMAVESALGMEPEDPP